MRAATQANRRAETRVRHIGCYHTIYPQSVQNVPDLVDRPRTRAAPAALAAYWNSPCIQLTSLSHLGVSLRESAAGALSKYYAVDRE